MASSILFFNTDRLIPRRGEKWGLGVNLLCPSQLTSITIRSSYFLLLSLPCSQLLILISHQDTKTTTTNKLSPCLPCGCFSCWQFSLHLPFLSWEPSPALTSPSWLVVMSTTTSARPSPSLALSILPTLLPLRMEPSPTREPEMASQEPESVDTKSLQMAALHINSKLQDPTTLEGKMRSERLLDHQLTMNDL
jgi:hypothetical protein